MKKPVFHLSDGLLPNALIAVASGMGCTLALCSALSLTASLPFIAAACIGLVLIQAVLEIIPKLRFLFWPLFLAGLAITAAGYADRLPAIQNALILFANGQPLALAAYSRTAALLMSLLFTAVSGALARGGCAFFPLSLTSLAIILLVSFLGLSVPAYTFLMLAFSLVLSARGTGVPARRALALALMIALFTAQFIPYAGQKNDVLSSFAEKARQTIGDYLFFTKARTAFSLSTTGWQPYGPDQLGGPVSPTDEPIMQVYTSGRTLLRGTIKNTYTGHAWSDTTEQRRYLFVNPRFSTLKRDLFDLMRPQEEIRNGVLVTEPMIVSMRAPSASTLYLTQRFTSPAGEGIISYFSPSTELFATRSLEPDSRYTFTGSRLTGASEGARRAVLASENMQDPYWETVIQRYLSLPSGIDDQVMLLAQQIVQRADNDFDRAAALCTFLQRNYPYTLAQNPPPGDRDFVSWFLLDEQQGYCTSFASALAVMGRAIGLPTRYVEGYAAEPDADNIARVTQEQAHAWTEIYFKGFGWLPFDATPGTGFVPDGMPDNDSEHHSDDSENSDDDHSETDHDPQDPSNPDQTPTPEPTPSLTPTATPEPTPSPSPTPEHHDPAITPTPEITPNPTPKDEPTPEPTIPPQPPDEDTSTPPNPSLVMLLVLLLIAALVILRLYLTAPSRVAGRLRRSNDQLLIWYRVCEEALTCLGFPTIADEGPATYLARAHESLGGDPSLTDLGKAVCISRYSAHKVARTQVKKAERTYRALLKRMNLLQYIRLYIRRILRGVHL